jgi:hypothetical protein
LPYLWWLGSSFQYIDDSKLPDQLAVPWQFEPKSINKLLRHEVVPDVPTDATVQRLGDNIINSKDHAHISREPETRKFRPPFPRADFVWLPAAVKRDGARVSS